MRKSFFVLLSMVISVTFLLSFMKPKESHYKNLKVLPKDISKEEMDTVMKHFTGSLGVKCNFCHARLNNEKKDWDFASDSLENKNFARYMMKMTQKINSKYFKNDVKNLQMPQMNELTCNSCHNGREKPARKPGNAQRSEQRPQPPLQEKPAGR